MTTRKLNAPALAPELDKWGRGALRELRSLDTERDPEFYHQGLLTLGQRLVRQDRTEPALRIFHFLRENIPPHAPLAAKVGREIDAIEGRGGAGPRLEFLLGRFAQDATQPATLAGMAVGSAVYQLSRAAFLGRLLSAPGSLVTRGFGAQTLAGGGAFALESPAFVLTSRSVERALGSKEQPQHLGRDVLSAYLMLGGLKLFAWGGSQALRFSRNSATTQKLLPQLSAYLGILTGQSLEHATGLRNISNGDTMFLDSLVTLLQFHVGGELAGRGLGKGWRTFQQERIISAENARSFTPSINPGPHELVWASSGNQGKGPFGSGKAKPFYAMTRNSKPDSEAPKIEGLPQGLSRLHVDAGPTPVNDLVLAVEKHLKRVYPSSLEIRYNGRVPGTRDLELLKERLRTLFESPTVPEGFLTAIAFLQGGPKVGLVYSKQGNKLKFQASKLQVSEPMLDRVSSSPGVEIPAVRTLKRVEDVADLLPHLELSKNPSVSFDGSGWNIRDAIRVAQMLESTPGFSRDQTFTLVLKEKSVQINFAWEAEGGQRRVTWKTLPIDMRSLGRALPLKEPGTTGAENAIAKRESIPPVPPRVEVAKPIVCEDNLKVLEVFSRLLADGRTNSISAIQMSRGKVVEGDLSIFAVVLNNHRMSEGRKISLSWAESPAGDLLIQNANGQISAELRIAGQASATFLLKPDFESQIPRFVKAGRR